MVGKVCYSKIQVASRMECVSGPSFGITLFWTSPSDILLKSWGFFAGELHDHVKVAPLGTGAGLKKAGRFQKSGKKDNEWGERRPKIRASLVVVREKDARVRCLPDGEPKRTDCFFPGKSAQKPRKDRAREGFQEKCRRDSAIFSLPDRRRRVIARFRRRVMKTGAEPFLVALLSSPNTTSRIQ